jgi:hypothetical protein
VHDPARAAKSPKRQRSTWWIIRERERSVSPASPARVVEDDGSMRSSNRAPGIARSICTTPPGNVRRFERSHFAIRDRRKTARANAALRKFAQSSASGRQNAEAGSVRRPAAFGHVRNAADVC